ncbi:hypothetical protein Ciccas_009290 [Cichlidogyrus casuarinus]|uniref:GOST seven transmembrane domain-containing protein n=1 Tax=Cichlidogyrus casuarinus TaxID=1844966 RepID=A0ABD2PXG3_9PLAT
MADRSFALLLITSLVSCCKASISRLLMLFLALGYGTTKARLGSLICRVYGLVFIYFVFAMVYAITHASKSRMQHANSDLILLLCLTLTDIAILWWSIIYLMATIKQVSEKKNTNKLYIYRFFTWAVAFLAFCSLLFMIVETILLRRTDCFIHWELLWIDEVFWHVLGVILLCIIIHLWRPGRVHYAYSIFIDPKQHDLDFLIGDSPEEPTSHGE